MTDPTAWRAFCTLIVRSLAVCAARDDKIIFRQKVCEMI
jgi:hypothetical protein